MLQGTFILTELFEGDAPDTRGVRFHEPQTIEWFQLDPKEPEESGIRVETILPNGMQLTNRFCPENPHPAGNIGEINSADIEQSIRNMLAFEFCHSFFHDSQDPNYGILNWAIYGNFKDAVTTYDFDDEPRQSPVAIAIQTHDRLKDWAALTNEGLRLRCGEMTAQEIRTLRAVMSAILPQHSPAPGLASGSPDKDETIPS
jgi:hypothetical protein